MFVKKQDALPKAVHMRESMLKVHLVGSNHRMRVQMTSLESPKRNSVQMGAWKCHTLCFERCTIYITHLSRHTHHMHTACFRRFQWRHLDAHAVIGSDQLNLASAGDDVLLWFWSLCVFADSGESEGDLQLRVKLWSSTATSASPWWCHPDTSLFNHCFSKYLCFSFPHELYFTAENILTLVYRDEWILPSDKLIITLLAWMDKLKFWTSYS